MVLPASQRASRPGGDIALSAITADAEFGIVTAAVCLSVRCAPLLAVAVAAARGADPLHQVPHERAVGPAGPIRGHVTGAAPQAWR